MPILTLGQVVATRGIVDYIADDQALEMEMSNLVMRHESGDWGDLDEEDIKANNFALQHGERILSSYMLKGKKVWVITEWDRSVTTILFPHEY